MFANSGTSGNLIKFIGCNSSWTPITTANNPTYSGEQVFSGSNIPFLNGGLTAGNRAANGKGISVSGDYIHIENFAVRGYETGIQQEATATYTTFKNVNSDYHGDMRADNNTSGFTYYLGRGFNLAGNYATMLNCFDRDADAQGVTIGGGGFHTITNFYSYTNQESANTTDYQFLFESNDNVATNINMEREAGTIHLGHGIVFKPNGRDATRNIVDGFYLINLRVEIQFVRAFGNVVRNGSIINTTGTSGATSDADYAATCITFANGSHDNLVENVYMYQPTFGINSSDWADGASSAATDDGANQGSNNTVNNIVVYQPRAGHIAFQGVTNEHGTENSAAQNLRIYNCTFIGGSRIFYYAAFSGAVTGGIRNTIFKDVGAFSGGSAGSGTINSAFVFDYVNNSGGLATSSYSPYTDTNLSSTVVTFTDLPSTALDTTYDFKTTVDLSGQSYIGDLASQGIDLNDENRTTTFSMGAVEFDPTGLPPLPTGTVLNSNAAKKRNFYRLMYDNN